MRIFELQIKPLIYAALNEDIKGGDITTDAVTIDGDPVMRCEVTAKKDAVVCGLQIFSSVFDIITKNNFKIDFLCGEGDRAVKSQKIISLEAKASDILYGERTALNFLQHMSGIATISNTASKELEGLKTKILDTRKTIPGLRLLQKYAVKTGGGENHRFDLSSGILIKDNHIKLAGGIKKAIGAVRKHYSGLNFKIEIETATLDEVKSALEAKADVIMLDNMDIETMKKAVAIIGGKAVTEASGNITIDNLRKIAAETEVDYISMGSLTNSVIPADFSLNFVK
jgi:nicotinate-nucleotide pyrophosphorylase (carboxylating)